MKISKANFKVMGDTQCGELVNSSETISSEEKLSTASKPAEAKHSDYKEAETFILRAIDALGRSAKEDLKAKEAIADLGVILLDLRG